MKTDRSPIPCFLRPLLAATALVLTAASAALAQTPFPFVDGDRVVLLGDTFVERAQSHGHIETVLTLAAPNPST